MRLQNLQDAALACSTVALSQFGEDGTDGYNYRTHKSIDSFKSSLLSEMEYYDSCYRNSSFTNDAVNKSLKKMAFVVAFTTHDQEYTNKFLEELGFIGSPFVKKLKHADRDAKVWYIPAAQLIEAVGYKPTNKNNGGE